MHRHLLADDEAIGHELADRLAGVCIGDLVHFIGVEPDLALAAADHGGREALLRAEVHPGRKVLARWIWRGDVESWCRRIPMVRK